MMNQKQIMAQHLIMCMIFYSSPSLSTLPPLFHYTGFLIDIAVPGVPEEVVNKIERHNFLQREEARAARHSIVKSQLKDIAKINDDSPPPLQDD